MRADPAGRRRARHRASRVLRPLWRHQVRLRPGHHAAGDDRGGLAGLEVYYPGYDAVTIEHLLGVARRYGLLVTGGTDFHGIRPNEPDLGGVYVPRKVVRRLREACATTVVGADFSASQGDQA